MKTKRWKTQKVHVVVSLVFVHGWILAEVLSASKRFKCNANLDILARKIMIRP